MLSYSGTKSVDKRSSPAVLTPTILLNLAADALHNVTDGVAIGVAFATEVCDNSVRF